MSSSAIYTNLGAKSWTYHYDTDVSPVQEFHKRLPGYRETLLVPLDDVAKEFGVKAVFVKDESSRLGLPAFKILGASWGTFRAIADKTGIPLDTTLHLVYQQKNVQGTPIPIPFYDLLRYYGP